MGDRGPEVKNVLDIITMSNVNESKVKILKSKVNNKINDIKEIEESIEIHEKYVKDKKIEREELYRQVNEMDNSISENLKRINFLSQDLKRYNLDLGSMKEDLINEVLK